MPDLARLRQLLDQATPGPWNLGNEDGEAVIYAKSGPGWKDYIAEEIDQGVDDAALIVEAVNSLPGLLDRLERLEDALHRIASYKPNPWEHARDVLGWEDKNDPG